MIIDKIIDTEKKINDIEGRLCDKAFYRKSNEIVLASQGSIKYLFLWYIPSMIICIFVLIGVWNPEFIKGFEFLLTEKYFKSFLLIGVVPIFVVEYYLSFKIKTIVDESKKENMDTIKELISMLMILIGLSSSGVLFGCTCIMILFLSMLNYTYAYVKVGKYKLNTTFEKEDEKKLLKEKEVYEANLIKLRSALENDEKEMSFILSVDDSELCYYGVKEKNRIMEEMEELSEVGLKKEFEQFLIKKRFRNQKINNI